MLWFDPFVAFLLLSTQADVALSSERRWPEAEAS